MATGPQQTNMDCEAGKRPDKTTEANGETEDELDQCCGHPGRYPIYTRVVDAITWGGAILALLLALFLFDEGSSALQVFLLAYFGAAMQCLASCVLEHSATDAWVRPWRRCIMFYGTACFITSFWPV
ncbi:hypothetical protein LTR37_018218 [Vermiconidia calcicola]|uniref:Uncharacterized protein n=1 Tax=Vermiconidia calcicola TaxID=1690605 RepID=A0ACC3MHK2_9PEZI|nr:hypothetical protein LTR37_018218 [Vermiconidia calcicola]